MKRLLSIVLCVVMAFGSLCMNVLAEEAADTLLASATGEETGWGCCGNIESLIRSDKFDPTDEYQYLEFVLKNNVTTANVIEFHQDWSNYQRPFEFSEEVTKIPVKEFINKITESGHDRTTVSVAKYDGIFALKEMKLYDVNPDGGDDILVATADNYVNDFNCYQNVEGLIHGDKIDPESDTQYLEISLITTMRGVLTFNWNGDLTTTAVVGEADKEGEYSVFISSADFSKNLTDNGIDMQNHSFQVRGDYVLVKLNIYKKAAAPELPEQPEEPVNQTGWFCTGEEYHAMIIGRAIISLPHAYNDNGVCVYCRYEKPVENTEVVLEAE